MSLVKNSNKNDCQTKICDDNGVQFESSEHLKNYVGTYFENIYKKRNNINDQINEEAINSFLGADILNRPRYRMLSYLKLKKLI
jgi:hypothetical protein